MTKGMKTRNLASFKKKRATQPRSPATCVLPSKLGFALWKVKFAYAVPIFKSLDKRSKMITHEPKFKEVVDF